MSRTVRPHKNMGLDHPATGADGTQRIFAGQGDPKTGSKSASNEIEILPVRIGWEITVLPPDPTTLPQTDPTHNNKNRPYGVALSAAGQADRRGWSYR